jgi:hypothetical protein
MIGEFGEKNSIVAILTTNDVNVVEANQRELEGAFK